MIVTGSNQKTYTEDDIQNALSLAEMRSTVLFNNKSQIVAPVNHPTQKHFRVLGKPSNAKLKGDPHDTNHDRCIAYLERFLKNAGDSFEIASFVPKFRAYIHKKTGRPAASIGESKTYELQTVFSAIAGSGYRWFTGPSARVIYPDGSYIESDLCGRATATFYPTRVKPNIVIEVIRSHPPDFDTFERLVELSKNNTFVLFFLIPENDDNSVESQFNRAWRKDRLQLRVSFYLMDGMFYEAAVHIPDSGTNRRGVYEQLVSGVLNTVRKEALSPEKYQATRSSPRTTITENPSKS
ncbi:MAG: Uncharacterized protein K0R79_2023 [Stenotrophomonas indicatrix]|jgi:hypothetical protein|uniref:Uncharacterized protein n=2 Tax=Stenotrophomonas TaxID=40323 RepID=A0AAJ2JHZ7_STEMA|nr:MULTISPECIES: hypothetical protein [Stenotrophomonas]MCV0324209.1 hypothetical protein [Stenotrophomonas sp. CFS3442]MDF2481666.1 Uncharacterized protein [Stenotrophomonas indicatrix]MDT3470244.1 hypothetical protein [Stenotrophomonas maltophilia]